MTEQPNEHQLAEYFRQCYRADSYDISLSNLLKTGRDRFLFISEQDYLLCGELPRLPVHGDIISAFQQQAETHSRERILLYGGPLICGSLEMQSGLSRNRTICSPLWYAPSMIDEESGDLYLIPDFNDLRLNIPLLRLILKEDQPAAVVDSFPQVQVPLTISDLGKVCRWLEQHSVITDIENSGRWPSVIDEESVRKATRRKRLSLQSSCCIVMADRARGVRGVLHELALLSERKQLSPPLSQLLGGKAPEPSVSTSEPELLPTLLSRAQTDTLTNAARLTLSQVSGPPGTGKSYTIAAMAIDRMMHGESVLIVGKTDQAMDVIADKLQQGYGLTSGVVNAGSKSYLKEMTRYLDSLLQQGLPDHGENCEALHQSLQQQLKELQQQESLFSRTLEYSKAQSDYHAPNQGFSPSRVISRLKLLWQARSADEDALWQLPARIDQQRREFEQQAVEYINTYRNKQLSQLLENDRGSVASFRRALTARNSGNQAKAFTETDFDAVFRAFPIWLVSIDQLSSALPFNQQMFDLLIVDEATQCDVASALPALYRSKRAAIVGDGQQLRHVSFLSRQRQQQIAQRLEMSPSAAEKYSYRDQSLLDITSDALPSQQHITMLDEHYRSKPELIAFSNQRFYQSRLKVMQARPGLSQESALKTIRIDGVRDKNGRNQAEAEQVLQLIQAHLRRYQSLPMLPSIGVLSPFRDQAEYLEQHLREQLSSEQQDAIALRVATPYGFQGEERDIMILSLALDNNSSRAATYLNREDVFNVAITRAREQQIALHSLDSDQLKTDNLLRHFLEYQHFSEHQHLCQQACDFGEAVKTCLTGEGYTVWTGYPIAGQEIDLLCQHNDQLLGIDLIGYEGDYQESFDLHTYQTLSRAGLRVIPLPYLKWQQNQQECLEQIGQLLG